jgi:hypothetical protein
MAFAAGVARVWGGTNGLLSTPATSAVIRMRGGKGYEPFGGRWFDGDGVGHGRGMYQFDMLRRKQESLVWLESMFEICLWSAEQIVNWQALHRRSLPAVGCTKSTMASWEMFELQGGL